MASPVVLDDMTWPQVADAINDGKTTVVVPCAAVEQHGPHLPLATDALLGLAIAERAARIAGNTLVAPPVRPGLSEHHMSFAGSLTLRPTTFLALLEDYCDAIARHGFRRVVLFPSHGGNVDVLRAHVPFLARRLAGTCEVVLSVRGTTAFERMMAVLSEKAIGIGRAGVHAGYVETAMMLAYVPELVRMERAEPGRCDDEFYRPENIARSQMESFLYGVESQSPNGVLGDPVGANADEGELLLQAAAASLAADLQLGLVETARETSPRP